MPWTIEARHLEHAVAVVARHLRPTPLIPATAIGPGLWLKLETDQPTGSFKVRGALAALAALPADGRRRGVVTASAGNHGLGVAWAGRSLGVRCRVLVPARTPMVKRDGIASLGAKVVVVQEQGYDATEARAKELAERDGETFVSPYDDPWVAAGNGGTLYAEIAHAKLETLGRIVAPVGGGGLVAGIGAARDRDRPGTQIIGVQSAACPAMKRSIDEGHAITSMVASEPTLAEGLEGGVTQSSYELVRAAAERVDLVSEAAIADAMRFAKGTLGLVVEGSAATVIAWAREHTDAIATTNGSTVLVVTGKNVDPHVLERVLG